MLKANGYKAGARELPADPAFLKQIKIEPQGSLKEGVVQTPTEGEAAASVSKTTRAGGSFIERPVAAGTERGAIELRRLVDVEPRLHGQRYVELKEINRLNAASLRPACLYQAGDTKPFHNNPVVYRGVMYITRHHSTVAIDATNCRVRWRHDWRRKSVEIHPPNRGAAIKDGRVVRATTDGYLFALDIDTGKLLWERKSSQPKKNEGSFNGADDL